MGWCVVVCGGVFPLRVLGGPQLSVAGGGLGVRESLEGAMRCSQGGGFGEGVRAGLLPDGSCERLRGAVPPPVPTSPPRRGGDPQGASEGGHAGAGVCVPAEVRRGPVPGDGGLRGKAGSSPGTPLPPRGRGWGGWGDDAGRVPVTPGVGGTREAQPLGRDTLAAHGLTPLPGPAAEPSIVKPRVNEWRGARQPRRVPPPLTPPRPPEPPPGRDPRPLGAVGPAEG